MALRDGWNVHWGDYLRKVRCCKCLRQFFCTNSGDLPAQARGKRFTPDSGGVGRGETGIMNQCDKCEGYGCIEGRYCDCSIGEMAIRDATNRGDHVAVAFNH